LNKASDLQSRMGYSSPYVFPSRRNQKNQKVGHVSRLADLAERLGKAVGFDFNPYNLRSAYINYAVESLGYDSLPVISANIGHIDVATTERYYRRQRDSDRVSAAHAVGKSFGRLHTALTGTQSPMREGAYPLDFVAGRIDTQKV
jgi:integrase